MRAFLISCLAAVLIGAGGYFALNSLQEASGGAFTAGSDRIDPGWSWRAIATTPRMQCNPRESWQWFFVDFGDPAGEAKLCSDSQ